MPPRTDRIYSIQIPTIAMLCECKAIILIWFGIFPELLRINQLYDFIRHVLLLKKLITGADYAWPILALDFCTKHFDNSFNTNVLTDYFNIKTDS